MTFKFALSKCCVITSNFKNLKLQLRVGYSNVRIAGRNVRLRHAIMVRRDCGQFCIRDDGDRVFAGFLWTPNYIVLRGANNLFYQ